MNAVSTLVLAFAMSADAFAAAIGKGAALQKPKFSEAIRAGLIFGTIEAITPVVGWALGSVAARHVAQWDHWIAFGMLTAIGIIMIRSGLKPEREQTAGIAQHSFWLLAATGFATSIDAMAVGVSLAFIDSNILVTAAAIGLATMLMVALGMMIGQFMGALAGRRAEIFGGLGLICIGSMILYEHLHAESLL